jgi:hypothetical protein
VNIDDLIRDTLREQARSTQSADPDLAGQVLARRARRRKVGFTVAAIVAVTAIAAAVTPAVIGSSDQHDPADRHRSRVVNGFEGHPSQSPPRDRIAAGNQVLAAYYTTRIVPQPNHDQIQTRTYSLLNPGTGRYTKDARWSDVAVAPGLKTAVVLEQALPAQRVGILDLSTGRITRWIPVPHGAGTVALSPNGSKLVVTTYDKNPDRLFWAKRTTGADEDGKSEPQPEYSRTGFATVDLPSGAAQWHPLAPDLGPSDALMPSSGHGLEFNADGTLLTEESPSSHLIFHRLDGTTVAAPANEKDEDPAIAPAGLSPDGTLMAGGFAGEGWKTATEVLNSATGKRAAVQRGQQLLAWADDSHLIAWDIPPGSTSEFASRLVLVTVGSDEEVPLTGVRPTRTDDPSPARWEAVFAHR